MTQIDVVPPTITSETQSHGFVHKVTHSFVGAQPQNVAPSTQSRDISSGFDQGAIKPPSRQLKSVWMRHRAEIANYVGVAYSLRLFYSQKGKLWFHLRTKLIMVYEDLI